MSLRIEIIYSCTFSQRFVHDKLPLARGLSQQFHQFNQGPLMEILGKAKTISAVLQGTDGLLEGFFVIFANTHHLAHSAHLGAELILGSRELLEGPAGKLHHNIITGRCVLL